MNKRKTNQPKKDIGKKGGVAHIPPQIGSIQDDVEVTHFNTYEDDELIDFDEELEEDNLEETNEPKGEND